MNRPKHVLRYDFDVRGPYVISLKKRRGGREITKEAIDAFWHDHRWSASYVGVYVFCIQHGRGTMPWYVGKATRSFKQEAFHSDKLVKYHSALTHRRAGQAVMFFIREEKKHERSKDRDTLIHSIEKLVIRFAKAKNPDLKNKTNVGPVNWRVQGYLHSGRGRKSEGAAALALAVPVK